MKAKQGDWISGGITLKPPHACEPPLDTEGRQVGRLTFPQPPTDVAVGSIWRCNCGQAWEIYNAAHSIGSGSVWHTREWRRITLDGDKK